MKEADVLSLDGKPKGRIALPVAFEEEVRPELIRRAVHAENTRKLQVQAHYPLAGMQTSARYYGRMHAYRTGRHVGRAIRPRQKLGGGAQGQVRRIPSATKGKRAHPHLVEKTIIEEMNRREYQKALASAVSATSATESKSPIIFSNEIELVSKTKDMQRLFVQLRLIGPESKKPRIRKGIRRSSKIKSYRKSVLLVIGKEGSAIKAARNIAGVDACHVNGITANLLAPGGVPGRTTVWSEHAIREIDASINGKGL